MTCVSLCQSPTTNRDRICSSQWMEIKTDFYCFASKLNGFAISKAPLSLQLLLLLFSFATIASVVLYFRILCPTLSHCHGKILDANWKETLSLIGYIAAITIYYTIVFTTHSLLLYCLSRFLSLRRSSVSLDTSYGCRISVLCRKIPSAINCCTLFVLRELLTTVVVGGVLVGAPFQPQILLLLD